MKETNNQDSQQNSQSGKGNKKTATIAIIIILAITAIAAAMMMGGQKVQNGNENNANSGADLAPMPISGGGMPPEGVVRPELMPIDMPPAGETPAGEMPGEGGSGMPSVPAGN